MKKYLIRSMVAIASILPVGIALPALAATAPNWNVTGNYVINMNYLGTDYPHDMSLTQDSSGNITGHGGSPAGANVYTWVVNSGTVSGNTIDFTANYTATADAVTPQTTMHIVGTIASGTISGTWSDNYQGGTRAGTWVTATGTPSSIILSAEDFGVVNYDTGIGTLKGYTAGFGIAGDTFAGATSVIVKLYSGTNLLQTNVAILPKFNTDIIGTQFSSPFDVSGNFAYATDGYWTNVRATQYGQSVPATRVVATVTLANGKIVTAENLNVTGSSTTIYATTTPPVVKPPKDNDKDDCKDGGWKTSTSTPGFNNQGQCVSHVENDNHGNQGKDNHVDNNNNKPGNKDIGSKKDIEIKKGR